MECHNSKQNRYLKNIIVLIHFAKFVTGVVRIVTDQIVTIVIIVAMIVSFIDNVVAFATPWWLWLIATFVNTVTNVITSMLWYRFNYRLS